MSREFMPDLVHKRHVVVSHIVHRRAILQFLRQELSHMPHLI